MKNKYIPEIVAKPSIIDFVLIDSLIDMLTPFVVHN
tara:strand:- start:3479 stop:3586 length:108 start_codon:yes stop_codon:yes gene_type:complete